MHILTSLKQHYGVTSLTQIVCVYSLLCYYNIYHTFYKKKTQKGKDFVMTSVHKNEMYLTFLT